MGQVDLGRTLKLRFFKYRLEKILYIFEKNCFLWLANLDGHLANSLRQSHFREGVYAP